MLWDALKEMPKKTDLGFPASSTLAESIRNFPALEEPSCHGLFPVNMLERQNGGPPPASLSCLYQTANTAKPRCSLSGLLLQAKLLLPSCFLQSQVFPS